jgi:hypothetical protein
MDAVTHTHLPDLGKPRLPMPCNIRMTLTSQCYARCVSNSAGSWDDPRD